MLSSYVVRLSRRGSALLLGFLWLSCFPVSGTAQDSGTIQEQKEQRNAVFTDLNPPLLALLYFPTGIKGYGLEMDYERLLFPRFASMVSVKYLHFSLSGALFQVWNLGFLGRYMVWKTDKNAFITSLKLGAMFYDSPYYRGGTFMTGLEISWRRRFGRHFVMEPYLGCDVCADDRYLMPFTVSVLTELLIPGFIAGVRFGIGF
ncbi:MAG: hypothetical protein LBK74_07335 [Treponema sp.]|jgi:hypothetical protein|nr:hypothetical protein [Treponema sp.]